MKKIITIVGARPQFIKAAMLSRAITEQNRIKKERIQEQLIHTGQHYDENMSHIFFSEMGIPEPTWGLHCGNASHGAMTGQMLIEIEKILLKNRPDYVVVYGDTDSTLAGALAASKLHIPVVHVEAGLRSFNKIMPEEQNRILTDHISDILCCPTHTAVHNLALENICKGVYHVGDIMYDATLLFRKFAEQRSIIMQKLQLKPKTFYLCTIHRAQNTENAERLSQICRALGIIATKENNIIFPLHPRTHRSLELFHIKDAIVRNPYIHLTEPLGFLDMLMLEKNASCILTDSGGIQKEAYFHRTPCITLREETEWIETVTSGWNQLAGTSPERIMNCLKCQPARYPINEYGEGNTAHKILQLL